jgi:hypothetical protein
MTVADSPTGAPKKPCNVDMILFIFHINDDITRGDFQRMACWPRYRAVRCRHKTFFVAPAGLFEYAEAKA